MNYIKIYNNIISKAKRENRKKTKSGLYYELHHITPKCIGGDNSKENKILLTAKEHFLAHRLLAEIYDTYSLWLAFHSMCYFNYNGNRRYKVSSRVYSLLKNKLSQKMKGRPSAFKNKKHSDYSKEKMSNAKKGKPLNEKSLFYLKLNQKERTCKRKEKDILTFKQKEQRKVLIFSKDYKLLETMSQEEACKKLNIAESTLRIICSNQKTYKDYILTYDWYKRINKKSLHQYRKVIEYLQNGEYIVWESNKAFANYYNLSLHKVVHFLNGRTKQLKNFNNRIEYAERKD